jgi:hypothetical protein
LEKKKERILSPINFPVPQVRTRMPVLLLIHEEQIDDSLTGRTVSLTDMQDEMGTKLQCNMRKQTMHGDERQRSSNHSVQRTNCELQ